MPLTPEQKEALSHAYNELGMTVGIPRRGSHGGLWRKSRS